MEISILTPSASPLIAIGNDTLGMAETLRSNGYNVQIYADDWNSRGVSSALPLDAYKNGPITSEAGAVIYHHAIGWPSGERLLQATSKIAVLRYHNITPAAYFDEYSKLYATACEVGNAATVRFARSPKLRFWAASHYSRDQLVQCGAPPSHCSVLPPFHAIERIASEPTDMSLAKQFDSRGSKLLSVSAIRPHKGHVRALRILAEYSRLYDAHARLVIAGTTDEWLSAYVQALHRQAEALGVAGRVVFAENITQAELRALYFSADVFLCVSEHEGFGVPLVEAMYFGVPVVAWGRTAVPETLGDAGITVREYDEKVFAKAIRDIVHNRGRFRGIVNAGRARYERCFHPTVLERQLLFLMEGLLAGSGSARHAEARAADLS